MTDQSRGETESAATILDRTVLDLVLQTSHPWTEAELTRAVSGRGDVPEALARLNADGLINRWGGEYAAASYAALRILGIIHGRDSDSAHEHREESIVLQFVLGSTDEGSPLARGELLRELASPRKRKRNTVTDAIERLVAAGVLDSNGDLVSVTRAALRYDQLTV